MDVSSIEAGLPVLIGHMECAGYSAGYIASIERLAAWIMEHERELDGWGDVLVAIDERWPNRSSANGVKVHLELMRRFVDEGVLPRSDASCMRGRKTARSGLCPGFALICDAYEASPEAASKKPSTVRGEISNAASFLARLEAVGPKDAADVTEDDVLEVLTGPDGGPAFSTSHVKQVKAVISCAHGVDGCTRLSSFLLDRAGRHWDGMPVPGIGVSDLDPAAIDAYRRKAVDKGRHGEADVSVSDAQVVSDLKLLDETQAGGGELTRAAILMFHPDPERFVTGASVKVAYYAPEGAYGANKSDDIIYQDEVHGPLMLQADKVVDLVYTKYLKALTSYEGLQRVETYMAPRGAFREVILNAINHKLYESGNPVQVSVYDDRIVVFNQGRWPEDIDLADVYTKKHSSYPHNPNLSKVFFNAGEIEAYGGGFAKIKIECDRYGAPYPELTVTPNGVTVEMRACELYLKLLKYGRYWKTYPEFKTRRASLLVDGDDEWITDDDGAPIVVEEVKPLDPETVASIDRMRDILASNLTDSEKRRLAPIYDYLKENDVIDAGIAMQVTGKSSSTVNRYLQRLVDLSVLAPVGAARSTAYRRI